MMIKLRSSLAGLAVTLMLGACGGGSGETGADQPAVPVAVDRVPPSASVSVVAYTEFAQSLANSEWKQPLGMDQAVPPTSETALPLALK